MKSGVGLGNMARTTIGGVCVIGGMTLRRRSEQHFLDQLDQVFNTSENGSYCVKVALFPYSKEP